ncbi:LytTR family DNA-binding domain-containing protein [Aquimarina sp. AU119]|uniref:LytR/AlgR family response regulator transcription factor n=1 Tax=Aquimarina sp. AU119 TaxID=2108528 RepID=UPI000D690DCD|nr:LytTR family DNA-binding domain-containing protein [Aquimarina sp. AU119]
MIKAIIIEDEDIVAARLQKTIEKIDRDIVITKRLSSVKESIEYLMKESPDLIFLDINLSDGYSFEIFESLDIQTPIVFITAYSEFAIKAFEQNSIDYLLKPVSIDALNKSMDKFYMLKNQSVPNYKSLLDDVYQVKYKKRFLVKINQSLKVIEVKDVAYFYSDNKLTFIKHIDGSRIPIDFSLIKLEELLDPDNYFRINRKYIIHHKSIKEMFYASTSKIKLKLEPTPEDTNIYVALERIGKFKKWLSK